MKSKELKDSHKAFADEYLVNGFNATQAYLKAYPDSTEEAAESSASRLLSNAKVKEYIEEQKKQIKEDAVMTKREKLKLLESWILDREERKSVRLKALEMHNKMTGDNEPEKIEHVAGIQVNYNKPE